MAHAQFIQSGLEKALAHVVEEAGEALAAIGKVQRFGLYSVNPLLPVDQQETNKAWLERELEDLYQAVGRLKAELPVD